VSANALSGDQTAGNIMSRQRPTQKKAQEARRKMRRRMMKG